MRFLSLLMVVVLFSIPAHAKNLVVLELFTSQFCSDAPIGGALFRKILERDADVIGVSCHIQGYNVPGEAHDEFSREFCDQRQSHYVRELSVDTAAVPLMVANGRYDMGGDREALVEAGIALARSEGGVEPVTVRVEGSYLEIDLAAQDVVEVSDVWLFAYDGVHFVDENVYVNVAQHAVKVMSWDGTAKGVSFPLADIQAEGYAVVVQNDVQGVIAAGRF